MYIVIIKVYNKMNEAKIARAIEEEDETEDGDDDMVEKEKGKKSKDKGKGKKKGGTRRGKKDK
jgi:hypothetical protein